MPDKLKQLELYSAITVFLSGVAILGALSNAVAFGWNYHDPYFDGHFQRIFNVAFLSIGAAYLCIVHRWKKLSEQSHIFIMALCGLICFLVPESESMAYIFIFSAVLLGFSYQMINVTTLPAIIMNYFKISFSMLIVSKDPIISFSYSALLIGIPLLLDHFAFEKLRAIIREQRRVDSGTISRTKSDRIKNIALRRKSQQT